MDNPTLRKIKRKVRRATREATDVAKSIVAGAHPVPVTEVPAELAPTPAPGPTEVPAAPAPEPAVAAPSSVVAPAVRTPPNPRNAAQTRLWTLLDDSRRQPIRPREVLWESFHGKGMLCHPAAMFRWMLTAAAYQDVTHVWALNKISDYPDVVAEFGSHPRVRFVDVYSDDYYVALSTVEFLVNNTSFPPAFSTRPEQVFMNTWHGTPLKTLGFDIPNGAFESKNVLRNLLMADLLLSSGPFMTDQMYRQAYRLDPIYEGTVLEIGSPRVDVQLRAADGESGAALRSRLAAKGLQLPHARTVTYAPTWKGQSAYRAGGDADELVEIVEHLKSRPDLRDTNIALRVHSLVYRGLRRDPRLARFLVPDTVETNELLAVTDVLVTDYSSLFFDFLSNDRPIVFHVPDLDQYRADRGYYLQPEEWPGALTRSVTELGEAIVAGLDQIGADDDSELTRRRADWRARFAPDEDGSAAGRAVARLMGDGSATDTVVRLARTDKERLLVYAGPFLANGITSSALNLFSQLDYGHYDVTVVFQWGTEREKYAQIDARVRQVIWQNPMPLTADQQEERAEFLKHGFDPEFCDLDVIKEIYAHEWRRTFGHATFDHVINFEGYTIFWSAFLLAGNVPRASIWLHNDLDWDRQKVVAGKRPHEAMLAAQFTSYQFFDSLVSVSVELMRVNRSKLHAHAPVSAFTHVHNLINADSIDARTYGAHLSDPADREDSYFEPVTPKKRSDGLELADTFDRLFQTYRRHDLQAEMRRRVSIDRWCSRPPGTFQFVAVGRLSPEKNHELLLDAWALVLESVPTARLVIAGDGPTRAELEAKVRKLGFGRSARIAGYLEHGLAVLANSDALVMPSLYEGLPMAILEAKYLGIPVVATDFGTVSSALGPGEGRVTQMSARSLAEGMLAAIRGEVAPGSFDADAWNAEAVSQFAALMEQPARDR